MFSLLVKVAWRVSWLATIAMVALRVPATAEEPAPAVAPTGDVLTTFDQIWHLPEAEQQTWHRVRLDYTVYFYDPLWQALWGRCGEADSYLSLGTKVFPIKAGQRIRVEGLMLPARGMRVDRPEVTILEESVPLEVVSTAGDVADAERFNKRLVTIEGFVDRVVPRDANHVELRLSSEGRSVVLQVLLQANVAVPQVADAMVRAKGVYFARSEAGWTEPRIEIWVQSPGDVDVLQPIDRDVRFEHESTAIGALDRVPAGAFARVVGTAIEQTPGKSIRLRDATGEVTVQTAQTRPVPTTTEVEAIGYPVREGDGWVLQRGLFRTTQNLLTSTAQLYRLSEAERAKWHHVRLDYLVYYYDPIWKAMWGRSGDSEDYLSLDVKDLPIELGQRLLIEGFVQPANGLAVRDPKVTLLGKPETLVPLPTAGNIGDTGRFDKKFVVVEGYVDRQSSTDASHQKLDLAVEGRPVIGRLLLPDNAPVPQVEGALIRARGVYSATSDPTSDLPVIELWMQSPDSLEVTGWLAKDARFSLPRTPIEELPQRPADQLVHVAGIVRSQEPGHSLTLRDETGQVLVRTAQAQPVSIGDRIEAIGRPALQGLDWILRDSLFRRTAAIGGEPVDGNSKLRLAEQLRELQPEEAARSYPVTLTGVITWTNPASDFFYLNDASGGVCVYEPAKFHDPLMVGLKVEVTGVSAPGRFIPVVMADHVRSSARIDLPAAQPVTLEQALTGVEEAQWVSMTGYARDVVREGPWTRFDLTTSGGEFPARLPADAQLEKLRGSVVRVRGVCSALTNNNRQMTGFQLWVPSAQFLEVEEAMPVDLFAVTKRSIAGLRQFSTLRALNRRVRVSGVVVNQAPGRFINLQDGGQGLLVLTRDTLPLDPGDRIEAVGFPGRENSRVVLREAVYRRTSTGQEPPPRRLDAVTPIDPELDGLLVTATGRLLDIGAQERGVRLIVQSEQAIFEALLDAPRQSLPKNCAAGARIALTGVYLIRFDEDRRPHAVQLQLRSPADLAVLQRPPRWTLRGALAVIGALVVVAGLGFGWVAALRRRVRLQIDVIGEQQEKEKAARLDAALVRASKLESLGVLAGGIAHDFNNLLTVVMGNLSLAKLDRGLEPETQQCIAESERATVRARELTQQLLTFAKGGEPVRVSTRLPDLVREAAQFALHGSKVRCEFEVAADLWPADVDKGQIGQVVHNIVINACQAMPAGGEIRVALRNEEITGSDRAGLTPGRYLRLTFADSGTGISAEHLSRIFEPYFTTKQKGTGLGLATVYSIVKKHHGHIEAQSQPGKGTTFHVWLPAAQSTPEPHASEPGAPGPGAGRVLLMDDEAAIRLMTTMALKRMGMAVTAVNDGAAVVSEYAAARAAGRPYDLVILDLTVPGGMGGAEAMERLRQMDPHVRAIVSSGYSSDPVMANFREYGFRDRVPKPYQVEDLERVIERVMRDPDA